MPVRIVVTAKYEAKGGPAAPTPDANGIMQTPTRPGSFVVAKCGPHTGPRWPFSRIAWGAEVRDDGKDLQFLDAGQWRSVRERTGASREEVLDIYWKLYPSRYMRPPTRWELNDFGHQTCYYFQDVNRNGLLDGKEHIMSDMFHTTPKNEAQDKKGELVTLDYSHGCIHVKPKDIDDMIKRGYMQRGAAIIVHRPSDHFVPRQVVPGAFGPYEVHFWPKQEAICVHGRVTDRHQR